MTAHKRRHTTQPFALCKLSYPNIWGYEDEADEIKDDLRNSFENLKKFYEKMAAQESAVLVSIY